MNGCIIHGEFVNGCSECIWNRDQVKMRFRLEASEPWTAPRLANERAISQTVAFKPILRDTDHRRKTHQALERSHEHATRRLWNEMHKYPVEQSNTWNATDLFNWYAEWEKRVPSAGCGCQEAWMKLTELHPIVSDSPEAFFRWTVDRHNDVNTKLNKRTWSYYGAYNHYKTNEINWESFTNEQPRVGFLAAVYLKIGGTETFHKTLIPRLGNVVGFAASRIEGDTEALGVPCGEGMEAMRDLARSVDVLVVWGRQDLNEILPVAHKPRIVLVHHGDIHQNWANDCIDHGFANGADSVVCVSPDVDAYQRSLGRKSFYIKNAIDPNRITTSRSPQEIREHYNLPKNKRIVLWSHRLSEEKRPQFACDIAKYLGDNWHMVIAGDGSIPIELNNRTTYVGRIDSPADLLSISDCFLSTAYWEGFGLAVGEAMAAGVPVVASPNGLAADPRLAWQVPVDTPPQEWARMIQLTVNHPSFARNAAEIIRSEFSVLSHLEEWHMVLINSSVTDGPQEIDRDSLR